MASKRGFSSMDPQKQREIASKGGKAAHQKGTAHEFTPDEAREAGRKGGASTRNRRIQTNERSDEDTGGDQRSGDTGGVSGTMEGPAGRADQMPEEGTNPTET